MGIGAQALNFAEKNLKYARAVAGTQAGQSFLRWGMIGAGAGAVYGMGANLVGNNQAGVMQSAIRGGMIGMGARGLFGGFKGLRPVAPVAAAAAATGAAPATAAWSGMNRSVGAGVRMRRRNYTLGAGLFGQRTRTPNAGINRGASPIRTPSRGYAKGQGLVNG